MTMDEFQIALLIGAALTALICIAAQQWRGLFWIAASAASFVVSTWYYRQGWPHSAAATATSDALICFAVYFLARREWEIYLFLLFQASVLTSLLYFIDIIGPHWAYVVVLEGINWLALLLIGATAVLDWCDARGYRNRIGEHLLAAHRLAWAHETSHRTRG